MGQVVERVDDLPFSHQDCRLCQVPREPKGCSGARESVCRAAARLAFPLALTALDPSVSSVRQLRPLLSLRGLFFYAPSILPPGTTPNIPSELVEL